MALAIPRAMVTSGQPPFAVNIVDRFATAVPLVCGHHWYRTKASWTGMCLRIATSAGGNPETDIPFDGDTLDVRALYETCGSNDGRVAKIYDPSGNGFDWIGGGGSFASMPKLWDGATKNFASYGVGVLGTGLDIYQNGLPIPSLVFDGINDYIIINSALGLTEAPALSVAWCSQIPAAATGTYWAIGDSALAAGKFMQGYYNSDTSVGIYDGIGYSINTTTSQAGAMNRFLHTRALNANMNACALYFAGAAAAQTASASNVPAIENELTVAGTSNIFRAMSMPMVPMIFNSDLAANATDRATLQGWMKPAHRCAA